MQERKTAEENLDRIARLNSILASRGLSNVVRIVPRGVKNE